MELYILSMMRFGVPSVYLFNCEVFDEEDRLMRVTLL